MVPELKVFFISMTPMVELRGALPVALEVYKLSFFSGLFFSVLGNLVPVPIIILFLEKASLYLMEHYPRLNRFFNWLFQETRTRHLKKFSRWERFALVLLVAIPLPLTGAWTASICSFLFEIPLKQAIPLIALGILISGILIALSSLFLFKVI